MTTNKDVRDMLGIEPSAGPKERPTKKSKAQAPPRLPGVSRELHALLGERAPPVPIQEPKQYKAKLIRPTTHSRWAWTKFSNEARTDGLVLKHWRKLPEGQDANNNNNQESNAEQEDQDQSEAAAPHQPYRFAKYNLQVQPLQYDDAEYNAHLKSDDWSREETDYLVQLYAEFYGKWPVIADRYDYKPSSKGQDGKKNGDVGTQIFRDRTMEDMKARYYEVSAKLMAAHTPVSNMTASEFDRHDKMIKYDPKYEARRKEAKIALLNRSADDRKEEEHLVSELRRIYLQQERFSNELLDIRERLDHSITDDPPNTQQFTTTQEITQLFQKVLAQDKNRKGPQQRRSIVGENSTASPNTANNAASQAQSGAASSNHGQPQKKSSVSQAAPTHRQLSARDEARFGVSSHERLTSGVTFRSDKLLKARQAKSAAQTQKIANLLGELQVPDLVQMPTTAVCSGMEKLVGKVNLLLDARKVREREQNEVLVARQQKAIREGEDESTREQPANEKQDDSRPSTAQGQEAGTEAEEEQMDVDKEEDEGNTEDMTKVKDEPAETHEADGSPAPSASAVTTRGAASTRNTKRSASVMSASSTGSGVSRANSKRRKA